MRNIKKITSLSILVALASSNSTMAMYMEPQAPGASWFENFWKTMDNVSTMTKQAGDMYQNAMDMSNRMEQEDRTSTNMKAPLSIVSFFRNDMTQEEKDALKGIIDSYISDLKSITSDFASWATSSEDKDALKSKIEALNNAFKDKVASYIDSSKESKYEEFLKLYWNRPFVFAPGATNPQGFGSGSVMPMQMKQVREIKKSLLSKKTVDLFNKKIDSIPASSKEAALNKIIAKIDALIAKTTKEKTKAMLQELKDITKMRLDHLWDEQDEEDTINSVLDDVTWTWETSQTSN